MRKILVMINGSGTHGKDTFIEFVAKHIPKGVVKNFSTIDTPKRAAALLGCPIDEKTDAARNFWSDIKDASIKYNDGPVKEAASEMGRFVNLCDSLPTLELGILFIHVREWGEIQKIYLASKNYLGEAYILLVDRPGTPPPECHKDDPRYVKEIPYDFSIRAATLETLEQEAKLFLQDLIARGPH